MPRLVWKHKCQKITERTWYFSDADTVCEDCGEKGVYSGWAKSVAETMEDFRRATGLPPIGPHMQLLPRLTRKCEKCNGKGLFNVRNGKSYRYCKSCNGTGLILNVTDDIIGVYRRLIQKMIDLEATVKKLQEALRKKEMPPRLRHMYDPLTNEIEVTEVPWKFSDDERKLLYSAPDADLKEGGRAWVLVAESEGDTHSSPDETEKPGSGDGIRVKNPEDQDVQTDHTEPEDRDSEEEPSWTKATA